ncbi:MAG: PEP-CTERM sorting domain-containing protein [Myxococcota bacterium]|nr:PEP-CTERM sorting domain-containing protein [Myxococcota bacterium]
MVRLGIHALSVALLVIASPASATLVDVVDGPGSMFWDTSTSVTSPADNAGSFHPNFPDNRHPHEGWFVYVDQLGMLYEFTNFTKTSDGVSQDVLSSTVAVFPGDALTLEVTYGVTAAGTEGFPDLSWSADLERLINPLSPFPLYNVRLFNVWDYDVGEIPADDTASVFFQSGATVADIDGAGGVGGFRGAFSVEHYTVDTLPNVLAQIQGPNTLNDLVAAGPHNVAGAFQWNFAVCADPFAPTCPAGSGTGSGSLGGYGGFGGFTQDEDPVPEPATAVLLALALGTVLRRGARRA